MALLKEILIQWIILLFFILLTDIVKIRLSNSVHFRIRGIDIGPPFLMCFIHNLTLSSRGFSWLPYLIIGWSIIGIVILIYREIFHHQVSHFIFYRILWRIGDLYFVFFWIIIMILKLV